MITDDFSRIVRMTKRAKPWGVDSFYRQILVSIIAINMSCYLLE